MNRSESSRSPQTRNFRKTLDTLIAFGTGVVVACGVMMWSVFNAWTNVLTFWANEQEGQAWLITFVMVILTCVVPFVAGLWLLTRTITKYQPSKDSTPSEND